jgi:hypothetical protein
MGFIKNLSLNTRIAILYAITAYWFSGVLTDIGFIALPNDASLFDSFVESFLGSFFIVTLIVLAGAMFALAIKMALFPEYIDTTQKAITNVAVVIASFLLGFSVLWVFINH